MTQPVLNKENLPKPYYNSFRVGEKVNRLTFIKEDGVIFRSKRWLRAGQFRCDCGRVVVRSIPHVRRGQYVHCGDDDCIKYFTTHKMSRTYFSFMLNSMKNRCYNKKDRGYRRYGGRGIKICDRWLGKDGLMNLIKDMGERPSSDYSIDRIDNDGNYEPSNCRWATDKQQIRNRSNNRYFKYNGKIVCMSELSELSNINYQTIKSRLTELGWSVEKAVTTPTRPKRG